MRSPLQAIARGRVAILTVAMTYLLAVAVGIAMVNTGNGFALQQRDAIVRDAQTGDVLTADREGAHLRAALLDFASNLGLGGITSTVLGIGVVLAYPVFAYRGWVGGIVSVDATHASRLADPSRATYYLVTLILQLIPYSIAGGMGVYVGIGSWRAMRRPTASWFGLPKDRLRDAALAYAAIAPLFLVASLYEFLA